MEKQLAFFQIDKEDDVVNWFDLPKQKRQEIETLFAHILIRYLHSSSKEVNQHEE